MPNVGDTRNLYFRFLDDAGNPLEITAPEDIPTLYLTLNDTVVVNDDEDLEPAGFEDWWVYAYTMTASGEIFARAKTTDTDAFGDGTTDALTFEVGKFHFTGDEGEEKVNAIDPHNDAAISAIQAQTDRLGVGLVFVRATIDPNGDTYMDVGKDYTGDYRLHYRSKDTRNLLASGTVVQLQFNGKRFVADTPVGTPGDWDIYVPVAEAYTRKFYPAPYPGELAVLIDNKEVDGLGKFTVTISKNP